MERTNEHAPEAPLASPPLPLTSPPVGVPVHDLMHVVQAERAVMPAFVPGSGPWRPFFADHDVAAPGAEAVS